MEETKDKKPTWYSLHKDQVRLIQYLLYHLKKHKEAPLPLIPSWMMNEFPQDVFQTADGQFCVSFD